MGTKIPHFKDEDRIVDGCRNSGPERLYYQYALRSSSLCSYTVNNVGLGACGSKSSDASKRWASYTILPRQQSEDDLTGDQLHARRARNAVASLGLMELRSCRCMRPDPGSEIALNI